MLTIFRQIEVLQQPIVINLRLTDIKYVAF